MMNRLILLIASVFMTTALAIGQTTSAADSARTLPHKQQTERHGQLPLTLSGAEERQKVKLKGFVDEDGNGIDDRIQRMRGQEHGQMMQDRMRDHFIDLDGDGINDDRCSGMCISQTSTSKGKRGHGMHK